FTIDRPQLAKVESGILHGRADGEATVTATAGGQRISARVVIKDSGVTAPLSFRNDVMPIFSKCGCNAGTCHGNFNGKNGFRLSLRGESPGSDLDSLKRDPLGRRMCRFDPEASLLLQKPARLLPHEGGVRFTPDSLEYATLRRWIASGCRPDAAGVPHVTR